MAKFLNWFVLLGAILCAQEVFGNKIIYMISPPRSLSVAFSRMMQERGDFKVFNEPSVVAFYCLRFPNRSENWFTDDAPLTFADVKNIFNDCLKTTNVFAKEMSYSVKNFLAADTEFVENPNVHFVFLLRDPHHTIVSFFKKSKTAAPEQRTQDILDYTSYKTVYEIYKDLKARAKNKIVIVKSEDLCTNTTECVKNFCQQVGIEFLPNSLHWDNLGNSFTGRNEWFELKKSPFSTHFWHGDAINSTGFGKVSHYDLNPVGTPTFNEIFNPQNRQACAQSYKESLHYYNLILKEEGIAY